MPSISDNSRIINEKLEDKPTTKTETSTDDSAGEIELNVVYSNSFRENECDNNGGMNGVDLSNENAIDTITETVATDGIKAHEKMKDDDVSKDQTVIQADATDEKSQHLAEKQGEGEDVPKELAISPSQSQATPGCERTKTNIPTPNLNTVGKGHSVDVSEEMDDASFIEDECDSDASLRKEDLPKEGPNGKDSDGTSRRSIRIRETTTIDELNSTETASSSSSSSTTQKPNKRKLSSAPSMTDSDGDGDEHLTATPTKKKRKSQSPDSDNWDDMVKSLNEFEKKYGHTYVPKSYTENKQLHAWVKQQRELYWARRDEISKRMRESELKKNEEELNEEDEMKQGDRDQTMEQDNAEKDENANASNKDAVEDRATGKENNLTGSIAEESIIVTEMVPKEKEEASNSPRIETQNSSSTEDSSSTKTHESPPIETPKKAMLTTPATADSTTTPVEAMITPRHEQILNELGFDWRICEEDDEPTDNEAMWDAMCAELRVFKEKSGHCDVPSSHEDKRLSAWVSQQRIAKKQQQSSPEKEQNAKQSLKRKKDQAESDDNVNPFKITEHHIKILDGLGFTWEINGKRQREERPQKKKSLRETEIEEANENRWHAVYGELQAFFNENGHSDVPRSHENKALGSWVVRQRMLYRRIREEHGESATGPSRKSNRGRKSTDDSSPKKSSLKGIMTEERIRLLNELKFTWDVPDRQWNDRYNELLTYREVHDDCNVPYENGALGHWVSRQRKEYQMLKRDLQKEVDNIQEEYKEEDKEKGTVETYTLTQERADRLKEIGFDFEPRRMDRDAHWSTMFDELRRYKIEHGDINVPSKKAGGHATLYQWMLRQRVEYKKLLKGEPSTLSNGTRIRDLDELGFDFAPLKAKALMKQLKDSNVPVPQAEDDDDGFERKLGRLIIHNARYGDCNVHREGSENLELIPWVEDIRIQYTRYRKKEQTYLTDKRVEIISKLGFEWASLKDGRAPWSVRMAQLKEYKEEHGNTMVPSDYPPNPSLGRWVNSQRLIYWKLMDGEDVERLEKKLSSERIEELNEMGFVWKIRGSEKDWDKMFDELQQYKEEYGDCSVAKNTDPKYDSLRKWVHSVRGLRYRVKNNIRQCNMQLTEERIKRLTDLGYEWPKERLNMPRVGWDARFEELRQYKEEHGNARVPRYYDLIPSLGTWCATQRSEYRKFIEGKKSTTLNEERIAALESLGFEFSITGSRVSWDTRYEELCKFKEEFGDCSVPIRFNANRKLGSWVTKQRNEYRQLREGKKTNMTDERLRKLEEIGFIWVDQHGGAKTNWEKKYHELRQYKAEFEDCLVPEDYQRNPRLGTWVAQQRKNYQLLNEGKPSDITEEQVSRLEKLGFSWVPKISWFQYYEDLLRYREEFGNVNVPREYIPNPPLGNWVAEMRTQYKLRNAGKPSKITDKRIEKLQDLGFLWKTIPRRKKVPSVPWDDRYEELKRYKEVHGNCSVPQSHPTLGAWMRSQKESFRKLHAGKPSSLTENRVEKLTDLGVQWEPRARSVNDWNAMLERLRQYKEEVGHTKVPRNFPQDQVLANWVATQRTEYNKFKRGQTTIMTEERSAALEELDFAFTIRGAKVTWDHRFEELRQYKEQFGDCLVPFRFNANPKLGSWVTTQRNQYRLMQEGKHTHMTQERIAKLNDIGFIWVDQHGGAKTNWEKKYHELRQYKAEFGDCLVPENYKRNVRLGAWVAQQRNNYQLLNGGHPSDLTNDQIVRLDKIGFDWGVGVNTHNYSTATHQHEESQQFPKAVRDDTHMQTILPPMVDFRNSRPESDRVAYTYDMDLQLLT